MYPVKILHSLHSAKSGLPDYTKILGQTVISVVKKTRKTKENTKENNQHC